MQPKRKYAAAPAKQPEYRENFVFPLGKTNFIIMAASVAMIAIGFILISGGATTDGEFNPEIFSARRIVIGPLIAFLGFIAMGVGIMWPTKASQLPEAAADSETKPLDTTTAVKP